MYFRKLLFTLILCLSCQLIVAQTTLWSGTLDATLAQKDLKIAAGTWATAQEGQIVRLHFEGAPYRSWIRLLDGKGNAIATYDTGVISGSAGIYDYTLEAALLATAKKSGITFRCQGYKLTEITLEECKTNDNGLQAYIPVSDLIYTSTNANFDVVLINTTSESKTTKLKLTLTTDLGKSYQTKEKSFTVPANKTITASIPFTAVAGFYSAKLTMDGVKVYTSRPKNSGKTYSYFTIGVQPEKITIKADSKSDLTTFWNTTKKELAKVAPKYKMTEIKANSSTQKKVYQLEFQSLKDKGDTTVTVRCYYAEPTGTGKYPCIIRCQPIDEVGATYDTPTPSGKEYTDYAELVLCTRGQLLNNRGAYVSNYGEWFEYGMESKENYYYRGAYMDAVRAIDFVASREHVDENNIYAEGFSQGGALSYAAAALSDIELSGIAPANPFMGDFPYYLKYANISIYDDVVEAKKNLGITDAQVYNTLSYFDVKNLASMVKCPVMQSIGVQDLTCPPHTNMAPYNNLPASVEKSIIYNSMMEHHTPRDWDERCIQFFDQHRRETSYTVTITESEWATVCLPLEASVPEGLTLYTVESANQSTGVLQKSEAEKLMPNVPYLVNGAAGTYTFSGSPYHSNTMPKLTHGCMTGTYADTKVSNKNAYILQNQEGDVAFYRIKSSEPKVVPAYQAYILLSTDIQSSCLRMTDVDGIEELTPDDDTTITTVSLQGYKTHSAAAPGTISVDAKGRKSIVVK